MKPAQSDLDRWMLATKEASALGGDTLGEQVANQLRATARTSMVCLAERDLRIEALESETRGLRVALRL